MDVHDCTVCPCSNPGETHCPCLHGRKPEPEIERLRLDETPGYTDIATWAVAVLDDGSEIRMRNLGDRVEVRGWDKTLSCNPPPIEVERISPHCFDVHLSTPGSST